MLTTEQKEKILRLAGVAVPDYPRPPAAGTATQQQQQGASTLSSRDAGVDAATQWAQAIDTLFVQYTAERAARSLRESEQARTRQ